MSRDRIRIGRQQSGNPQRAVSMPCNGIKINTLRLWGTDGNSSKGVRFPLALPFNPTPIGTFEPNKIGRDRFSGRAA